MSGSLLRSQNLRSPVTRGDSEVAEGCKAPGSCCPRKAVHAAPAWVARAEPGASSSRPSAQARGRNASASPAMWRARRSHVRRACEPQPRGVDGRGLTLGYGRGFAPAMRELRLFRAGLRLRTVATGKAWKLDLARAGRVGARRGVGGRSGRIRPGPLRRGGS